MYVRYDMVRYDLMKGRMNALKSLAPESRHAHKGKEKEEMIKSLTKARKPRQQM